MTEETWTQVEGPELELLAAKFKAFNSEIERQVSRNMRAEAQHREELARAGCEICHDPPTVMVVVQPQPFAEEVHMRCDDHREFTADGTNVTACSPSAVDGDDEKKRP